MIKEISFSEICTLWDELHPGRKHKMFSTMCLYGYNNWHKTEKVMTHYFGYYIDDKLVGVNSGHTTALITFRSRGLYVLPEYRNQGIGLKLLKHTIKFGFEKYTDDIVWSYPRKEALNVYEKAGFKKISDFEQGTYGINCYVSCESI
jgi:GNAT superfamily N-acetyltransferase